ncbi:site-specific DNA-methyltransferase, partial [Candidatus Gracilibacteria bacterium]|nr:site-specific DNA-methyltransferase [Candidatus Gracilibacteria bacterium]
MNQNLFKSLEQALKKDSRFISNDENQILLKNVIRQAAEQLDEALILLLLDESSLREVFFKPISDVIVFDSEKFITFLNNKEFLPDSYTAFKNKVGLSNTAGDYLSDSDEVVLSFPYKDCVLAGGQDKEDTKRQEVFYNEVLGRDEIDRLLDPKTFTNFKKYTTEGQEKLDGFTRGDDRVIKDNLIIKGNNLLALHSLKKEFAGKVKLIYIDPPYNTGNDSFNYNDRFNHSTWLTFMKNRLEVARELLRDDGVIFVQCDDNEQAYLKVLMDDIFKGNFIETITVVNNPRGRDYGGIANMHEFINVFGKSENYTIFPLVNKDKEFPFEDENGGFEVRELRNRNTKFNIDNRPNLVYPFYINPKNIGKDGFYEISLKETKGWIRLLPLKSQGIQTVWRWGKEKSLSNMNINIVGKIMKDGGFQIVEKYRGNSRMARSVWFDKEVNSERGTLHLKQLFRVFPSYGLKFFNFLSKILYKSHHSI